MLMKFLFSLLLVITSITYCFSQGIFIDNSTTFKDGIYTSYEDFINNEPSLPFKAFHIKWEDSPYFNKMKMKSIKRYTEGKLKKIQMHKIWGFCIGGVPYIQYSIGTPFALKFGNQAHDMNGKCAFSRIRILGNICHFNIEDHIPRSNSRFNSSLFTDDVQGRNIRAQKVLKLNTGNIYPYDEFVLSQLIKDDEQLAEAYSKEENAELKMFMYLQKYNERNPIMSKSVIAAIK